MVADATAKKAVKPAAARQSSRKALGRGLAALMPGQSANAQATSPRPTGYRLLPIERVTPNRSQPRKVFDEQGLAELAASIKSQGVLQPIIVRRMGDGYEIVAGERRWRAANRAGVVDIPAVIKDLSDGLALQVALIENVQRQDLDPLEEAEAYSRLIRDHKLTHEQIAAAVGKSRSVISNSLRLLRLPEPVLQMLADGRLTAGHARALMVLDEPKKIMALAEDIVGRSTSVREAETKVRQLQQRRTRKQKGGPRSDTSLAEASVQERLQQALGTRVKLLQKRGKGRIEIYFHSLDALDALLDKMLT